MFLWGKCRGEDVAHDALLIDDVGYASRQQSKRRGNAIKLPDLAPYIAQQDKGQAVVGCKTLVRLLGVRANTYDLCPGIFKDFVAVSKGACLGDTAVSVILDNWIPVKMTFSLSQEESYPADVVAVNVRSFALY